MRRLTTLILTLLLLGAALAGTTACARLERTTPQPTIQWNGVLVERFDADEVVDEARSPERSTSRTWWLGSGGGMVSKGGVGSTLVGESPAGYFRTRYALRNPIDTDQGRHPQNLFRLVTQRAWNGDVRQQGYFRILDYRTSESPQRYAPNGVLLFNRYEDENNLYYAGVRVDGHAVIKKKSQGVYYTLAEKPVIPGAYDRDTEPILLPKEKWFGLRAITRDNPDGSATISLYMDESRQGKWTLILEGIDAGVGGDPLTKGRTGIRTDFMDVAFDDYTVSTAP